MTTTNCGDTCGLIDFTMAVAGDRLLPEERMKLAIEAVTSEKMSQRGAAAKYGVAQSALSVRLKKLIAADHPTKTQSTTGVATQPQAAEPIAKDSARLERQRRHKAIRQLAKEQGVTSLPSGMSIGQAGHGQIYQGLVELGISVPDDLLPSSAKPKAKPKSPSPATPAQTDDANKQGIPANDPLPVFPDRPTETDPEDDAILDERIDLNKLSQQVLSDVISSARSDSFKRAATLATELEQLLCLAFYGKDDWSGQDWVHINGQLKTCHSLAGQRAEEAHREVFHERYPKGGAVAV